MWTVEVRDIGEFESDEVLDLVITDAPVHEVLGPYGTIAGLNRVGQSLNGPMIVCGPHLGIDYHDIQHYSHDDYAKSPEGFTKAKILAYTNPGDLVCDPFCGWSTTGVVAIQTGRRYLGTDISLTAIQRSCMILGRLEPTHSLRGSGS